MAVLGVTHHLLSVVAEDAEHGPFQPILQVRDVEQPTQGVVRIVQVDEKTGEYGERQHEQRPEDNASL